MIFPIFLFYLWNMQRCTMKPKNITKIVDVLYRVFSNLKRNIQVQSWIKNINTSYLKGNPCQTMFCFTYSSGQAKLIGKVPWFNTENVCEGKHFLKDHIDFYDAPAPKGMQS